MLSHDIFVMLKRSRNVKDVWR